MSKWTDFVKDFARRHNLTYGCALSDPACSKEYKEHNPKLTKKEKKEGENMGAEEQTGVVNKDLHKKAEHKKRVVSLKAKVGKKQVDKELLEKYPALAENKLMGAEDTPAPPSRVPTSSAKATAENKKKAGRPKKYATEAEAKEAKKVKTIESNKRRAEAKKASKTPENAKALKSLKEEKLPRKTAVQQLAEAQAPPSSAKGLIAGYSGEGDNGLTHIYPLSRNRLLKMCQHLL